MSRAALLAGGFHNATPYNRIGTLFLAGMVLFAACVLPAPVRAQRAVTLASLQISIWPEFDRPSSLVILDGQLASSVLLPAELTVRLPAAAQAPNAVAVTGTDGSLLQAAYTTAASGGDIIIKFTTSSAVFRVEYYDPALVINGDSRSFVFRWKSDFAIAAVGLKVQEPYGAKKLNGQPALTAAGTGEYGLNYDTASLGALPAGGMVSLDLSYTKSGSTLSATAVGPAQGGAGAPASTPSPAADGLTGSLPWILGAAGLGLVLVAGGAVWYGRRTPTARGRQPAHPMRRQRAEPVRAKRAARKRLSPVAAATGAPDGALTGGTRWAAAATLDTVPVSFCTQCGQRHQSGDRFCRQCGATVRE